jgi:DNA-directed RNA polymerase beta' subunit
MNDLNLKLIKNKKYFIVYAKNTPQRLELIIEDINILNLIDELCQIFKKPNRVEMIVFAIQALKELINLNLKIEENITSNNMKNQKCKNCGETTKDSLAEELELCQECWEDECDKDWWKEVAKLKVKNNK